MNRVTVALGCVVFAGLAWRRAGIPDVKIQAAAVREAARNGVRALAAREEISRQLFDSLDAEQRAATAQPGGLPASQMNAKQLAILEGLLDLQADRPMAAEAARFRRAGSTFLVDLGNSAPAAVR